jgi:hypothetical protein
MLSQAVEPDCRQRLVAIESEIADPKSRLAATARSTTPIAPPADNAPDQSATNISFYAAIHPAGDAVEAYDLTHWAQSTAANQRGC